jgi:hypothetical protein
MAAVDFSVGIAPVDHARGADRAKHGCVGDAAASCQKKRDCCRQYISFSEYHYISFPMVTRQKALNGDPDQLYHPIGVPVWSAPKAVSCYIVTNPTLNGSPIGPQNARSPRCGL